MNKLTKIFLCFCMCFASVCYSQTRPDWSQLNNVPHLAQTLSVCDYGAIPNDLLEDTAAFQAALDVASNTLSDVIIPAGVYYVSSVTVSGGTVSGHVRFPKVIGAGAQSTFIMKYGTGTAPIINIDGTTTAPSYRGATFGGFTVIGSNYSSDGIYVGALARSKFTDIHISGCDVGLNLAGVIDSDFSQMEIYSNLTGVLVASHPTDVNFFSSNRNSFKEMIVFSNLRNGFDLVTGCTISIRDCDITGNSGSPNKYATDVLNEAGINIRAGFAINGYSNVSIADCWLENNVSYAILSKSTNLVMSIRDCTVLGSTIATIPEILVQSCEILNLTGIHQPAGAMVASSCAAVNVVGVLTGNFTSPNSSVMSYGSQLDGIMLSMTGAGFRHQNLKIYQGNYTAGNHLQLGSYHLWVASVSGVGDSLYINKSQPGYATDGAEIFRVSSW